MKKTFYHATPKKNTFRIMSKGIKASEDGCVYLCDNIDASLRFMELYHPKGGLFAVIPIILDECEVKKSFDHNKDYLGVDAYIYEGDIPRELIPQNLEDILLYKLAY